MGKQEIRSNIAYYQEQMGIVGGKIRALKEARSNLTSIGTKVDYTLKSHEDIKENHHLAGTPYLDMTNNEEELIKEVENYFKNQKEFFLSEIDRKIQHHQLTISSYSRSISLLQISLAEAEAKKD